MPSRPSVPCPTPIRTCLIASLVVGSLLATPAAGVVCQKKKSGALKVRDGECKRNEIAFDGLVGPPGPAGADGQLRVYGDGSAGARTITGQEILEDTNLQYTDFTVPAGATVTVDSGTVIRCTGTFTNNGQVFVFFGGSGGSCGQYALLNATASRPPNLGVALAAPTTGERGTATLVVGGLGGDPLNAQQARTVLMPGPSAGGGGACGLGAGGPGAGGLTILAGTAIANNGAMEANPRTIQSPGGGGGSGGVIVLASRGSVTNNGALKAEGANGGEAYDGGGDFASAAGGGGGGGIVHLLAPVINAAGSVSVAGGAPGATGGPGSLDAPTRIGGGGGGACGGRGGGGGSVNGTTPSVATAGEFGLSLQSVLDPTSLF